MGRAHDGVPSAESTTWRADVVVVGSGNAGLCAALAARDAGASVLVLERGPAEWVGGNSHFTAGAIRTTFEGLDDLRPYLDLPDEVLRTVDLPPYRAADFLADMRRVTLGRTDPALSTILVEGSADIIDWLARKGVRWTLQFERQSFEIQGRRRFWGDLPLGAAGGGAGLIESEVAAARAAGVEIAFGVRVTDFHFVDGRIRGVVGEGAGGQRIVVHGAAVVLACGGFEADARRRATYLGPGWDLALVRGTPYNTGDGLEFAIRAGAAPAGHWSGCHSIAWDSSAPPFGDRLLTNRYSRQAYPFGLVVNAEGRRFIDEGADFRNYTYARYGAEILHQPGARAFQLFDRVTGRLASRVDYDTAIASRYEADTIHGLAEAMGVDPARLARTVEEFNSAVQPGEFDPTIRDGKRALGIAPPKSNWAVPLAEPPFVAYGVTCGITFTFGGLRTDHEARVLRDDGEPLGDVFAAGEILGGLFYHNYPGGTGLASGAVFGRIAGEAAGRSVRTHREVSVA